MNRLTHDTEVQKKGTDEKGEEKRGFAKSPLSESLRGKLAALVLAAVTPAAIAAMTTSSCTFTPAGLETIDGDTDATHDTGPDSDADVDTDSGHDAGPDADVDADVDAGPDADVDADVDSGPDADVDADVDAGPDADVDADVDAGPDADVDAGPVACVAASTGTFNDAIAEGASQTVGGYVFTYVGPDGASDVVFNITCGGNPVETDYTIPLGSKTTLDVTIDGKKIEITPHFIEVDHDINVAIVVSAL